MAFQTRRKYCFFKENNISTVDYKDVIYFYIKSVKSFKLSSKAKKLKNKIAAKV